MLQRTVARSDAKYPRDVTRVDLDGVDDLAQLGVYKVRHNLESITITSERFEGTVIPIKVPDQFVRCHCFNHGRCSQCCLNLNCKKMHCDLLDYVMDKIGLTKIMMAT